MLKGLMTYNAPLEMSANKGNGTRLKERLVGVPKEKVWTLPIKKNILKKYLKIASKYYIIYIEKRKKRKRFRESEPVICEVTYGEISTERMPHRF